MSKRSNVILTELGEIDWHANGWPNPNPEMSSTEGEYSTRGMPMDIFEEWQTLCDLEVGEGEWRVDW